MELVGGGSFSNRATPSSFNEQSPKLVVCIENSGIFLLKYNTTALQRLILLLHSHIMNILILL